MPETNFGRVLTLYRQSIPFEDPDLYANIWNQLSMAASPDHVFTVETEFMSDRVVCTCGWESEWYWDGVSYAKREWLEHVEMETSK